MRYDFLLSWTSKSAKFARAFKMQFPRFRKEGSKDLTGQELDRVLRYAEGP